MNDVCPSVSTNMNQKGCIRWADEIHKVVGEAASCDIFANDHNIHNNNDKSIQKQHLLNCENVWYGQDELRSIDAQLKTLISIYQQRYYNHSKKTSLREVEDEFIVKWGHSLRGLEPYECGDAMMYHVMTARALRDTLKQKSRATLTSERHATEAHRRGLFDELVVKNIDKPTKECFDKKMRASRRSDEVITKDKSGIKNKSSLGSKLRGFLRKNRSSHL